MERIIFYGSTYYKTPPCLQKLREDVLADVAAQGHELGRWNPFNVEVMIVPVK